MRSEIIRKLVLAAFGVAAVNQTAFAECRADIDLVWTGVRVPFGGATTADAAFVAYYDQERRLVVAKVDQSCKVEQKVALPTQFKGWDSHNEIKVAIDGRGILHVAGNMHVSPLTYFVSSRPGDAGSLHPGTMSGLAEDRVTYPRFLHLSDGRLVFLFRHGKSGDGTWFANIQTKDGWRSAAGGPILADRSSEGEVNAYPADFVASKDGYFHTAIVWRRTPDAASNYRVSYLRTRDFSHWETAGGKSVESPASPETAELVDDVGVGKGLLNGAKISLDPEGSPTITYTKYTESGKNGVFLAAFREGRWTTQQIAESSQRFEIAGQGSLPLVPKFTGVTFGSAGAEIGVEFPRERSQLIALSAQTLKPDGRTISRSVPGQRAIVDQSGLVDPVPVVMPLPKSEARSLNASMSWVAQGVNGDRPRGCTPAAPRACNPPAKPLTLLIR